MAKYSYLSDGTKLSATDADGNGLYYLGSLVYGSRNGDLSLESAAFNGGRFIVTSNGIESHYFVTDHLGSVRAVVNNDGEVIERNDYYPFGLRWNAGELSDNRYRYNGKETQSFVDVPYTDYGARMLDSKYRLGWNGNDPLAEATPGFSPFAFCNNNPTRFVDHFGLQAEDTLVVNKIEPVVITERCGTTINTIAYYMLPMVSFNDAAQQAAADGRWGAYAGNLVLGALEGAAFYVTIGQSSRFVGYVKMSVATTKIAKATAKIDKFIVTVGKLERKAGGVRQAVIKGGNIEKTFSSLVEGGVRTSEKTFRLADGTYVTRYNSSTNGISSIWIHRPDGQAYKIRFD
ncbi:hypothetical protein KG007_08825 [Alistipes sp. kh20]|uniref:RHS repeat domain-containing protein n=1 Tax=Alistipes montrealensis TaxID=2834113 RepID=UPI001BCB1507|nr:RHS repeat-associated core domain-containing protein [Alistipes montrealensis]MBS4766311.1 hypothetical protein [Alistipes montrealensis]